MSSAQAGLNGSRVAVFESRFSTEMARLVQKHGGTPLSAPTLVETPLTAGPEVQRFVEALRAGEIDIYCVLTGVGQRRLVDMVSGLMSKEEMRELLARIVVAARGPKAQTALREIGIKPQVMAPEPHTWEQLFETLSAHVELRGKRVALQQYGVPHPRLTAMLCDAGASVMQVPVYRWELPSDLAPVRNIIEQVCEGAVECALFTSAPQVAALLQVADQMGKQQALREGLSRVVLGSIGPSCSEGMQNHDIEPDFEPQHGKMGHLVLEAVRCLPLLLAKKRGQL